MLMLHFFQIKEQLVGPHLYCDMLRMLRVCTKKYVVAVEGNQSYVKLRNVSDCRVGLHKFRAMKHITHKSLGEPKISRGKQQNIYFGGSWNGFQLVEAESCSFSGRKVAGVAHSRFLLRS